MLSSQKYRSLQVLSVLMHLLDFLCIRIYLAVSRHWEKKTSHVFSVAYPLKSSLVSPVEHILHFGKHWPVEGQNIPLYSLRHTVPIAVFTTAADSYYDVLTAVSMKMAVFSDLAPCRLVWVYQGDDRPDDGGSTDLWNVGKLIPVCTALQPKRQPSIAEDSLRG
jgi:hypothetical protein